MVKNTTDYDWGNEHFSREYEINNGKDSCFVAGDDTRGMQVSVSRTLKISAIEGSVKQHIYDHDKPPAQLDWEGTTYQFTGEYLGECQDADEDEWTKLVNWLYEDKAEEKFISIDRWGENDLTAAQGSYVRANEFSNLLPGS